MKSLALFLAFCVVGSLADGGFHSHRGRSARRFSGGRRGNGRVGRARFSNFRRRGRQEDVSTSYGAPAAAPIDEPAPAAVDYPLDADYPLEEYTDLAAVDASVPALEDYVPGAGANGADYDAGFDAGVNGDAGFNGGANGGAAAGGDANFAMLEKAVPGIPGEDYPIYSVVPETGFTCDGQVEGGYYADPEAQCQVFHICTADAEGGLAKYSFLCPNGTVFNQNYFICDWWFNFDCSEAESLYARNDEIRAEQEANIGAVSADNGSNGGFGDQPVYVDNTLDAAAEDYPAYDYEDADVAAAALDDASLAGESPLAAYGVTDLNGGLDNAIEEEEAAPLGAYGAPAAESEAERAARRFRFRGGRRLSNSRRGGRRGSSSSRRRGSSGRRSRAGRRLRNNSSRRNNSRRNNARRAGRRNHFRG